MNEFRMEGLWRQLKGSARQRWGQLTRDPQTELSGHRDLVLGKIQERFGRVMDEVRIKNLNYLKNKKLQE